MYLRPKQQLEAPRHHQTTRYYQHLTHAHSHITWAVAVSVLVLETLVKVNHNNKPVRVSEGQLLKILKLGPCFNLTFGCYFVDQNLICPKYGYTCRLLAVYSDAFWTETSGFTRHAQLLSSCRLVRSCPQRPLGLICNDPPFKRPYDQ